MVNPYMMGLSYHKWLEMAVVLFFLAFPGMDVGNPLPASVLNASMKTTPSRKKDIQAGPHRTGRQNHPLGWLTGGTEEVESAIYEQSLLASRLKAI